MLWKSRRDKKQLNEVENITSKKVKLYFTVHIKSCIKEINQFIHCFCLIFYIWKNSPKILPSLRNNVNNSKREKITATPKAPWRIKTRSQIRCSFDQKPRCFEVPPSPLHLFLFSPPSNSRVLSLLKGPARIYERF